MLTFLFLKSAKEDGKIDDVEDILIACVVTIFVIFCDILVLLFQPVLYLVYRFLSKEDKNENN